MATEAQIAANRKNAKSSTGPKTPEGKETASANSTTYGLFTTRVCVHRYEREAYGKICHALWADLEPQGPFEEMYAAEILRAAWRLERCAEVEFALTCIAEETDYLPKADPMQLPGFPETQTAVDRARTQTANHLRRVTAELRALQNERRLRAELNVKNDSGAKLGISSGAAMAAVHGTRSRTKLEEAKTIAIHDKITKRTQFSPQPASPGCEPSYN